MPYPQVLINRNCLDIDKKLYSYRMQKRKGLHLHPKNYQMLPLFLLKDLWVNCGVPLSFNQKLYSGSLVSSWAPAISIYNRTSVGTLLTNIIVLLKFWHYLAFLGITQNMWSCIQLPSPTFFQKKKNQEKKEPRVKRNNHHCQTAKIITSIHNIHYNTQLAEILDQRLSHNENRITEGQTFFFSTTWHSK